MKGLKFLMLIGILMVAGCSGSAGDTAIRIAQMQTFADVAERALTSYDERITVAEETIGEIRGILADPNLGVPAREEMLAAIDRGLAVKAKLDDIKAAALLQLQALRATIVKLEADGIQPGADLIIIGEQLKDAAPLFPTPIGAILVILGGIAAGVGEIRRKAAVKVTRGVVASVDAVVNGGSTNKDREEILDILKSTQRKLGVRAGVTKILDT